MKRIDELFECPKCGCREIEEVTVEATVETPIIGIEGRSDDLIYGDQDTIDGQWDKYQCRSCGWQIPVEASEDLGDYLENEERECKPGCFKKEPENAT